MEEIVRIKVDSGDASKKLSELDSSLSRIGNTATSTFGATQKQLQALTPLIGGFKTMASGAFSSLTDSVQKLNPLLKLQEVGWKGIGAAMVATPIGLVSKLFQMLLSAINPVLEKMGVFNPLLIASTAIAKGFGDVASRVAEVLQTLFTDPVEGIKQFGALIEEQITVRFNGLLQAGKSLGNLFGSLFTGDFEGAKKALISFGDAAVKVVTGTSVSIEKTAEALNTLQNAGNVDFSAAEAEIRRLNEVIADGKVAFQERLKAQEEAAAKEETLNQRKLAALRAELNALVQTGASEKEIFAKQKEVNQLEAQAAEQRRARARERRDMLDDEKSRLDAVKKSMDELSKIKAEAEFKLKLGSLTGLDAELAQLDAELQARINDIQSKVLKAGSTPEEVAEYEKKKQEAIAAVVDEYNFKRAKTTAEFELTAIERRGNEQLLVLQKQLRNAEITEEQFNQKSLQLAVKLAEEKFEAAKKAGMDTLEFERELVQKQIELARYELDERIALIEQEKRLKLAKISATVENERKAAILSIKTELETVNAKLAIAKEGSRERELLLLERAKLEREINKSETDYALKIGQEAVNKFSETFAQASEYITRFTTQAMEANIRRIEREAAVASGEIQKEIDAGVITQEEAAKKLQQIEEAKNKKIREEKRKQAQIDKALAISQATINTAQAVLAAYLSGVATPLIGPATGAVYAAIAAAFGAAQIAAIASTPLPEFKKGVIGLQGPGTETSDSIVARLSKGESVMTAAETRAFLPTLLAIRNKSVPPEKLNSVALNKNDVKVIVNVDERGFMVSEWKNGNRINYLDKRVEFNAA